VSRAGEQAGQARSAGGWRDQCGSGGHSRAAKQASRLQLQDTEARQSDPGELLENFQALPEILDGCIIRAPETIQESFFFSILMEAGMVLSGKEARDYSGAHFRLQRKKERRSYSDQDSKFKN
jgi:hypothetical protein